MSVEIELRWDSIGEGALDLRSLLDAPAGKHGFMGLEQGQFRAQNGTRLRFFGVNLVFEAAFPEPEEAAIVAERLARAGVNLVRFHHVDSMSGRSYLDYSGGNSRKLSAEHMARFDRLFAELKARGIYTHFDLYTLRRFQPGDGLTHPDDTGYAPKWITYFDDRVIALQEEMAEQLLTHRNPHTGLRYVDDPAVAVVQIVNENSAFWWASPPPAPYQADVQRRFNAWLLERFGSRAALAGAWTDHTGTCALEPDENPATGTVRSGPVGTWNEPAVDPDAPVQAPESHPVRTAHWRQFLHDVQSALYRRRAAHLRSLGVRCCINGTNLPNGVSGLPSMAELDVTEHNCYWDHPLDGFRPPVRFHLAPQVRSEPGGWGAPFSTNMVAHLSQGRVAGKPFVVTEYYQSMPNPYRAECIPFLAAYAAYQDWDGLCLFSFSHGNWTAHADQRHLSGMFNAWNDPSVWGTIPLAAFLFHRDVSPARKSVAVAYSPVDAVLPYPDWRLPYSFLPFLARLETVFTEGRYEGSHDAVLSAGFTPTLDCTEANHALVYARSPYTDLSRREADPAAVLRNHRPDLTAALSEDGRRISTAALPPGTAPLALTGKAAASAGPRGTTRALLDDRFCLVLDPAAMQEAAPDWLQRAYAAAMRRWNLGEAARMEPGRMVADTAELDWDWHHGLLAVNTPCTQGAIGFGGRPVTLADVTITLESEFGVVALSSLDGEPLASARRLLVTAVGRSANTGMLWNPDQPDQLLDEGHAPVTFEPLQGWVDLPPRPVTGAWALDPSGRRIEPAEVVPQGARNRLRLGSGAPALHYELELG